jgi:hypothetical protein
MVGSAHPTFGIGTDEVIRVGGPRRVSYEIQ